MFFWSRRCQNDAAGFWEIASLSLLWHLLTSVLQFGESQARKPPRGEKIGPYFSSSSALTGSGKLRGNWAGPWVAGFTPEITFAWCKEYFNVQQDPCNDSWRPALCLVSGRIAVWRQQANPEGLIQSLAGRKARAYRPESLALFPVFFILGILAFTLAFLFFKCWDSKVFQKCSQRTIKDSVFY